MGVYGKLLQVPIIQHITFTWLFNYTETWSLIFNIYYLNFLDLPHQFLLCQFCLLLFPKSMRTLLWHIKKVSIQICFVIIKTEMRQFCQQSPHFWWWQNHKYIKTIEIAPPWNMHKDMTINTSMLPLTIWVQYKITKNK